MNDSMFTTVLDGPQRLELRKVRIPAIDENKVLMQIALCGICGSDLAAYQGTIERTYPYSPGHEFCGRITAIGDAVTGLEPGQRVVIDPNLGCGECAFCLENKPHLCDFLKTRPIKSNGGLSEWVVLDHRMVHALPDTIPDELAVYIEPLSCAIHACRRAEVGPKSRVAILGAGNMGILTAIVADSLGADVILTETSDQRRKLAMAVPGLTTVPAIEFERHVRRDPIDIAIDCCGNAEAAVQAIAALTKGGRLILLALMNNPDRIAIPLAEVTSKEIDIRGTWLNPGAFGEAIDLAAERAAQLRAITTRQFELADVESAFSCAASQQVHKVIVCASVFA
jgi:L-iditol 2-dehydrogenase